MAIPANAVWLLIWYMYWGFFYVLIIDAEDALSSKDKDDSLDL